MENKTRGNTTQRFRTIMNPDATAGARMEAEKQIRNAYNAWRGTGPKLHTVQIHEAREERVCTRTDGGYVTRAVPYRNIHIYFDAAIGYCVLRVYLQGSAFRMTFAHGGLDRELLFPRDVLIRAIPETLDITGEEILDRRPA